MTATGMVQPGERGVLSSSSSIKDLFVALLSKSEHAKPAMIWLDDPQSGSSLLLGISTRKGTIKFCPYERPARFGRRD
jgi:hypothetical protein